MKKLILPPLFLFLLLSLPAAAHGAELFVAPGGDNTANNCQTEASPCLTINHAVSESASGDRINIANGTYEEQVDLSAIGDDNLSLEGESRAGVIVEGAATWAALAGWSGNNKAIFRLGASEVGAVSLQNLTIDGGSLQPLCDDPNYGQLYGIYSPGKSFSLDGVTIQNITKAAPATSLTPSCVETSSAIYATASTSGAERVIDIEDSFLGSFLKYGATVSGEDWSFRANDVAIEGSGESAVRTQGGFLFGVDPLAGTGTTPNDVLVTASFISNMIYTDYDPLDPQTLSRGVFYEKDPSISKNFSVEASEIDDVDAGVVMQGQVGDPPLSTPSNVEGNTLSGRYRYAVVVDGGLATVKNNLFSPDTGATALDPRRGVTVISSMGTEPNVSVIGNRFPDGGEGKLALGVEADPPLNTSAETNLLARENSFLGYDPVYALQGTASNVTVDLEKNWWGCNAGPTGGAGCSVAGSGASVPNWLQFGLRAKPTKILSPGGSSEITASLKNSGGTGDGSLATNFPTAVVTALSTDLGTLADSSLALSNGEAFTALTRGATNGLATVSGTLDSTTEEVEVGFWQALENTAPPVISGSGLAGEELSVSAGTWTGDPAPTFTYQWQIADRQSGPWQNLPGATTTSYTPASEQSGKFLRVRVLATSPAGNQPALSDPFAILNLAPTELLPPRVYGVPQLGNTLQGFPGVWTSRDSLAFTYQWQRTIDPLADWEDIEGATEANYTVSSQDRGGFLRLRVSAGGSGGQASAASGEIAVFAFGVGARKLVSGRPVSIGLGTVPVAEVSCLQGECQIEKATMSLRARKKRVAGGKIIFEGGTWSSGTKTLSLEAPRALLRRLLSRKSGLLEIDLQLRSSNGSLLERNMRFGLKR